MVAFDEPLRNTRLVFTVARQDDVSHQWMVQSAIQTATGGGKDPFFPVQTMIFGLMGTPLPQFFDAWSNNMHEPGGPTALSDPGFTFRGAEKANLSRDDKTFSPIGNQSNLLCAHQISTPLRTESERWSLLTHVQVKLPNCTPSDAIPFSTIYEVRLIQMFEGPRVLSFSTPSRNRIVMFGCSSKSLEHTRCLATVLSNLPSLR